MAIYNYDTRIRYSEIDSEGKLTVLGLLDLFQNCSTFQSEDLNMGVKYLKEKRRAWVLTSWQIIINRMPKFGDEVTVQTWSHGIRIALGNRNFTLLDEKKEVLAYADSQWAYIDTDKVCPVKADEEVIEAYGCDKPIEMEKLPRRIVLNGDCEEKPAFSVPHFYIDTNNHMNNAKYVLAALEFVPQEEAFSAIRAEYKNQALLGDIIIPSVYTDSDKITVAMHDKDDNLYATVQFIK